MAGLVKDDDHSNRFVRLRLLIHPYYSMRRLPLLPFSLALLAGPLCPASTSAVVEWMGMEQGHPVLLVDGPAGSSFTLQSSPDLYSWDREETLSLDAPPTFWTDPESLTEQQRFYRSVSPAQPKGVRYVGAGDAAMSAGPITPALPPGILPGDLLILFLETSGPSICVADFNGGTWLALARGVASPQSCGSGGDEVHLTGYYSRYNGIQGAPTTTDSGDHQLGRMVAFRGVVAAGVPWDGVDGTTEAANDTSGYIPGAVTTVPDTLVVAAIATARPGPSGASFSGWNNSNGLLNVTEHTDDSIFVGNGGSLGIATGEFAPSGESYGRIRMTLSEPSCKAMLSVALKPEVPAAGISNSWPADGATSVGRKAAIRWNSTRRAESRHVWLGTRSPGAYMGTQTGTTFHPGTLEHGTTYYWRVDERNSAGRTVGEVRSFTTAPAGVLPDFTGMMLGDVLEELAAANCNEGTITRQFDDDTPPGAILGQFPSAGSALAPGMTVDLIRSRGPEAGVVVFPNGPDLLEGEAIPVHRAPALVTSREGTILAFTGHRNNGAGDEDDIDLHLRRSTDGGETWGPVIVVADDNMNPCKNAVPVVLPSGRILLMWLWNAWIPDKDFRTTREVMITWSDDDGLTWAPHQNITSSVYRDNWNWYGAGPCHAFIKQRPPNAGRIIFPNRHGVKGDRGTAHIIYSDDGGETFHLGGETTFGNESTVCEQSDGYILMNMRVDSDYRRVGVSRDGGMSFTIEYYDTQLLAAGKCQGSILEHSMNPVTGKANILFSNPDDLYERINGTIKLSEQDGDLGTWVREFRYSDPAPAFSGYSDISVINGRGDIGILWEFGSHYSKPARWDGGVKFRAITFNQIDQPYE